MKESHRLMLLSDYAEVRGVKSFVIAAKLAVYFCARPVIDWLLRKTLARQLSQDMFSRKVDRLLLGDGGMFKSYIYRICNQHRRLRGSCVLVPGAGYGRSLIQLAYSKPKLIVAFDLYEYQEEWNYLKQEIKERFGVELILLKGGFEAVPQQYIGQFDFVISEAVLEHVKDLNSFATDAVRFLEPGGIFYASYGPIWYGPSGDHVYWGENKVFDHLLLPPQEYRAQFLNQFSRVASDSDSTEAKEMIEQDLFSRLKAYEYIDVLEKAGLEQQKLLAKISLEAVSWLRRNKGIGDELDKKSIPVFDRFCSGFYLWMKK